MFALLRDFCTILVLFVIMTIEIHMIQWPIDSVPYGATEIHASIAPMVLAANAVSYHLFDPLTTFPSAACYIRALQLRASFAGSADVNCSIMEGSPFHPGATVSVIVGIDKSPGGDPSQIASVFNSQSYMADQSSATSGRFIPFGSFDFHVDYLSSPDDSFTSHNRAFTQAFAIAPPGSLLRESPHRHSVFIAVLSTAPGTLNITCKFVISFPE